MGSIVYDGSISGGNIASTITVSGSNMLVIPYANGMRVLIIKTDTVN